MNESPVPRAAFRCGSPRRGMLNRRRVAIGRGAGLRHGACPPVIINDTRRFAFVHIPKCAGTAVRRALEAHDETGGRFSERVDAHPRYGMLDYTHIPLRRLAESFPDEFDKIARYDSFAVSRDPFSRFPSALSQRIKIAHGGALATLSPRALRAEIDAVLRYLSDRDHVVDPDYIHFARQTDFVMLDGRRIVRTVIPIERLELLAAAAARLLGTELTGFEPRNRSMTLTRPALRPLLAAGSAIAKRLLPTELSAAVRARARRIWMRPAADRDAHPALASREVRDFIASYYAADMSLHENAMRETAMNG